MKLADWHRGMRLAQWGLSRQRRRIAKGMLARADAARAAQRHRDAGLLFEELARLWPRPARFHVQAGHMFKEARDFARAETQYRLAAELMPDDADLALQLGHFYKVARRPAEALVEYRRAVGLRPGWREASSEVAHMEAEGAALLLSGEAVEDGSDEDAIVELLPSDAAPERPPAAGEIELRRLGGRREPSRWGRLPLMTGVEAVRGVCRSAEAIDTIELLLDGETLHSEPAGEPIREIVGELKYVFNIWVDLGAVTPGPHRLEVRIVAGGRAIRRLEEAVLVASAAGQDWPASDGWVVLGDTSDGASSVEARVRSLPSIAHPARRNALGAIRRILVLRTDQLGDMVVSIPALRRIRTLFPDAQIVGLATAANVDLGHSTGLFDELLLLDFPVDPLDHRRVLSAPAQAALRAQLAAYAFDLCLDLGVGRLSRPLLRLSGARVLAGVNDREWPWLTVGLDGDMHDPKNHGEAGPHSAKLVALVERLASLVDSGAEIMRRADLSEDRLKPFGVARGDYVILHCAAAQVFTRWPHFAALAHRLLKSHACRILILGDPAIVDDPAFAALTKNPRVSLVTAKLPFDDFDALLSFAALFVGNDSGPKHLAALRGVPVISLHNARTNWGEWGQEQTGVILSRRVPCAGCSVVGDGHECGKDFACLTDIRVEEVMAAVSTLLPATASPPGDDA